MPFATPQGHDQPRIKDRQGSQGEYEEDRGVEDACVTESVRRALPDVGASQFAIGCWVVLQVSGGGGGWLTSVNRINRDGWLAEF